VAAPDVPKDDRKLFEAERCIGIESPRRLSFQEELVERSLRFRWWKRADRERLRDSVEVRRRRPAPGRPGKGCLPGDDRADVAPSCHRVVERCVAIPRRGGELLVAVAQLHELFVGVVAHDEAVKRELANGGGVTCFVCSYPVIGGDREKQTDVVVRERKLLTLQDRDREQRAVVLSS